MGVIVRPSNKYWKTPTRLIRRGKLAQVIPLGAVFIDRELQDRQREFVQAYCHLEAECHAFMKKREARVAQSIRGAKRAAAAFQTEAAEFLAFLKKRPAGPLIRLAVQSSNKRAVHLRRILADIEQLGGVCTRAILVLFEELREVLLAIHRSLKPAFTMPQSMKVPASP